MKKIISIIVAVIVVTVIVNSYFGNENGSANASDIPTETAVLKPEYDTNGQGFEQEQVGTIVMVEDYVKDGSYQRSEFGKAWADVDGNGCDTRNDVLSAWLHNITVNSKCQVLTGELTSDPYTGHNLAFVRGEGACSKTGWVGAPLEYNGAAGGCSTAVTIDHVMSLEEAWYLGASEWSFDKRVMFANDTDNLIPTGMNSWKNSQTPSQLLTNPDNPMSAEGVCVYVNAYMNIINKYEFPLVEANWEAISQTGC